MKRRLDRSADSRRDDAIDAKKRSRLLDVAAFGLPFILVVLVALGFGRSTEKSDAPFDAALEILEGATTSESCQTPTASIEENADVVSEVPEEEKVTEETTEEITETSAVLDEQTAPNSPEPSVVETEEPQESKLGVEEAERLLAQLEFQFAGVKKSEETNVDALLASLSRIRYEANEWIDDAPEETSTRARQTLDEVQALYRNLDANRAFFSRLNELDGASLDSDSTRAFFDSVTQDFPANGAGNSDELDEYRRDFTRVASSLDALRRVDLWNRFVDERGKALERFYVSKSDAEAALNFARDYGALDGTPREVVAITKRERELEYAAQNEVATRRKILLRIEAELAKKYWTYRSGENSFYYLPESPHAGTNEYIADAHGNLKSVDIPQNAPEIQTEESPQKSFLRELFAQANDIQDETRAKDVARWYREWCAILTEIQGTDRLDPILQYALFRDVAKILSSSDYYFARRLEPLTRTLNAPGLADSSKIDIFRAEEDETRNLRTTARTRLTFLPKDHLKVDKTTEQLDANVPKIAWNYRRVGWLDRNLAGEWRCRRADDAPELVGDLWVFPVDDALEQGGAKARQLKIGVINGRQATVNLIASDVPRGTIVFCRVRTDCGTTVAKRSGVERIFRR